MDANGEELFKFESTVVGGAIPKEYIPAVGEGIEEAMKAGILGGFPTFTEVVIEPTNLEHTPTCRLQCTFFVNFFG